MKVDVSLDLYRIFCAVVRTGNMSAAARELFISQPAVSMSIRQLEDRMGSPLLVRTAKGVYPTAEGKLLYTYLEQALGLIQAAEEKYYQMVHMEMGDFDVVLCFNLVQGFQDFFLHTLILLSQPLVDSRSESIDISLRERESFCFGVP
mgnify:CR=1 FL=1